MNRRFRATVFAVARHISAPFDCGSKVEIELKMERGHKVSGTWWLIINAGDVDEHQLDGVYAITITRIE